ncbi:hypothetical protein LGN16_31045 [Burkholderia vietnamiensis]|uniref:hypothetical protein n=1 Tax=Burkholderia vietnamiensis TaxID=60552 RepID=UPI001B93034A|nr:hypothetical protein [Burkholderia vietnamiensis]MBR8165368.1 hypothetical protein [Burkholderia vietnamiensis]MCA8291377.1 hypothetical protein [Burkholderia vietnamiensis]
MPEVRLTWHTGSVLPYASLWHTVLRACALNALHPRDLPSCLARPPANVELIENRGHVDETAFALALGESPTAFRWSSLGALPPWLDCALVVPRPRLCLACLAAGYHAALFSIALLDTCPIHGMPLVDRCHCGAPFPARLRSLTDYGTAGSCRCGRLHFFTHDTCRQPVLTPAATRCLDPVAAWLDAMSSLIRPARLEEALRQPTADSIGWLAAAADTLGVPFPACFRTIPSIRAAAVAFGTRVPAVPLRRPLSRETVARHNERTSYWPTTPAITVYRALARHVRRHLAPGSMRWVAGFIDACDALMIAEQVAGSRRARQAFVELLWGRAAESNIEQRRWPDRPPPDGVRANFVEPVAADCLVRGAADIEAEGRHWLACHAARVSLGAAWRDAQARATAAARSGVADWSATAPITSWRDSAWLARLTPAGLTFVSSSQTNWAATNRVDKATRQAIDAARRQGRRDAMWAASRGACLTWSDDAGWHVIDAITPADCDLRRRRLLGLPAGRPWCWLYRSANGRFVARVDGARLQVLAATPAAAIMTLRRCATDYRRVCQVALPHTTSVPLVVPEPLAARPAADYRFFVACVRGARGFWDDASKLAEAARCYRRAQAQLVRAAP